MFMRLSVACVLVLGLASLAGADVTMKQTTSGKGMGFSAKAASTTYIKGMRLRTDSVTGDTTRTTIFDVAAQKMYSFDSKKKEADVWDMAALSAEIGKNVDVSQMKASMAPNGMSKEIAGRKADGYDMEISMPAAMGDMKMAVTLAGPLWIVKGAPGTEEVMAFYKAAVEKGWIFSDPRAAKGQPGQAKAMAEMYRQMSEAGGIAYEQTFDIKLSGDGPLAGMMARMGGASMTTTTESVTVGALADDMFQPPAGYKLNNRK